MDQVKEFLGVLKRQHFWFLAPILLIVGIVGWVMATSKLEKEFETGRATVEGYLQKMQSVSGTTPHPNDEYQEGMEALIAQRRDNVRSAWQKKWDRQKQQLRWPEELPAGMRERVETMRPIESLEVRPDGDLAQGELPGFWLRNYGEFIKRLLPSLAEKIGAKWAPSRSLGNRGSSGSFNSSRRSERGSSDDLPGRANEPTYLVEWDPGNQGAIEARFDWGDAAPKTIDVLYAQEDLWVLESLIDIIDRTNGEAMTSSQAAIKQIQMIAIGADVAPPSAQGFHVVIPTAEGDGTTAGADMISSPEPSSSEPGAADFSGEGGEGGTSAYLLKLVKGRYYDENYQPIENPAEAMENLAVAKRIPVRLRVVMDQRRINELLVQCANAPLTFEVRQLRFNPKSVQSNRGMGGMGGSGFDGRDGGGSLSARTLDDYQSFDRVVELFGIVYIFNPVDNTMLKIDDAGEDGMAADDMAALPATNRRRLALAGR